VAVVNVFHRCPLHRCCSFWRVGGSDTWYGHLVQSGCPYQCSSRLLPPRTIMPSIKDLLDFLQTFIYGLTYFQNDHFLKVSSNTRKCKVRSFLHLVC
jgi:hypothetical protein